MKYIMPIMFLASLFFSLETVAGQFNCDLKISKNKRAENTPLETVQKTINCTYQVAKKDLKLIGYGALGFEIITYKENVPEKDFGKIDQWEYSNCSNRTVISGECIKDRDLDDREIFRCPATSIFKCDRIPLVKKTLTEYKEEQCVRATECASEIHNTDDLNNYIKLQDALCRK